MKHTIESVTKDLTQEHSRLSVRNWSRAGDINPEDHGGIKYRKCKDSGEIDLVYYRGLIDLPEGIENEIHSSVTLSDLIDGLEDIWGYSDVENCGLDIGLAIMSLQSYNGILH